MNRVSCRAVVSWALCFVLVANVAALAQQSTSYQMKRLTIAAAPASASSTHYTMQITPGQEGPIASVSFCNLGFTQTVGFWSLAGNGFVPTVLEAVRNGADPSVVDLNWSGSAVAFEVFRATLPFAVNDPAHVIEYTADCAASDAPPGAESIVFYLVEPAGN